MRADPSSPITRLELERWALGRLDPERAAALERQGRADGDLAARMARIQRELQAARELPPLELPAEVPASAPRRLRWLWPTLAAAVAAVWVVVLLPLRPSAPRGEVFRGAFDLELTQVRLGQARPQGALVHGRSGDRLQYTVVPTQPGSLSVYDLQDDGSLEQIGLALPVAAGRPATGALLLDDYPGSERLFFLLAAGPVDTDRVQAAVERAHDLPLAELDQLPGLGDVTAQRSVLVIRETSP